MVVKGRETLSLTLLYSLAGTAGFEPANAGTKTQCLTAWRRRHYINKWCPEAESNHRHGDFQSPALPTELSRRYRYWLLPDNGAY